MNKLSTETKNKISKSLKGHNVSLETRNKIRASMQKHVDKLSRIHRGKLNPMKRAEVRQKVGLALKGRVPKSAFKKGDARIVGKNNPNWKDGITPINEKIRKSREYKKWRQEILKRDDYACLLCGKRGGKLCADHIKPFSLFPELRLEPSNGRTLCVPCHQQTDTYARRVVNYA